MALRQRLETLALVPLPVGVSTRIYCTDTKHAAACPENHRAGPQWRLPAHGAA